MRRGGSKITPLDVRMNGIAVGNLSRSSGGELSFSYVRDWLGTPGARPISLSMPLRVRPLWECVLSETFGKIERVISEVEPLIPKGFPGHVSESIFEGMLRLRKSIPT